MIQSLWSQMSFVYIAIQQRQIQTAWRRTEEYFIERMKHIGIIRFAISWLNYYPVVYRRNEMLKAKPQWNNVSAVFIKNLVRFGWTINYSKRW